MKPIRPIVLAGMFAAVMMPLTFTDRVVAMKRFRMATMWITWWTAICIINTTDIATITVPWSWHNYTKASGDFTFTCGIGFQPVKTLIHRLEAYATFVVSKLPFAIQFQRAQIRLCPPISEGGVPMPCIVLHQHFQFLDRIRSLPDLEAL
jgi:hypothetical protein